MATKMFLRQVFLTTFSLNSVIPEPPDMDGSMDCQPYPSAEIYYHSPWNKTTSPSVFQKSFCSKRCRGVERFRLGDIGDGCEDVKCIDCSCKRPECEYYGICCPDISEEYSPPVEFQNKIINVEDFFGLRPELKIEIRHNYSKSLPYNHDRSVVGLPKLGCEYLAFNSSFLYIRSCFKDFTGNAEIVRQCQENVPASEITVDNYAWVIDIATSVVYRNIHCAVCNRAITPQQLPVITQCYHFMSVYHATDQDEMLRAALKKNSCCTVERKIPPRDFTFSCNQHYFKSEPVSSCDSAPPEWEYDEDVAKACHDLNDTIYRVWAEDSVQIFKNLFCAICNMNTLPAFYYICDCVSDLKQNFQLPFSLLINFGKSSTVKSRVPRIKTLFTYANCSIVKWSSPDNRCIALICSPGKLVNNRKCSTAFANISGLHYSVRFVLYTHGSDFNLGEGIVPRLTGLMKNLTSLVQALVIDVSFAQSIRIGYIIANVTETSNGNNLEANNLLIWVETKLIAFSDVKRDKYEQILFGRLIEDGVNIKCDHSLNLNFSSLLIPLSFSTEKYLESIAGNKSVLIGQETKWLSSNYKRKQCSLDITKALALTGVLVCSYITFNQSHYNITIDYTTLPPVITVTVDLNVTRVSISTPSELNRLEVDEDEKLNVCHEVLDAKLNEMKTIYRMSDIEYRLSDVNLAQYIVTMTSLGCSMVCLVITIFTYFWFPILRNTAGKNNILLCKSLFLAQASLIVGAHKPSSDFTCKLTGVLTHFLWLWMLTWTFICSYQMFRVFTAPTRIQPISKRDENKQWVKRVALSLIGPTAIVISVIVWSLGSSDGEFFGYGRDACYLDSTLLNGVSMILPMALSTVSNIIFFIITTVSISKIRQLQTTSTIKKESQKQLYVFAKLSSMTGAFWTIAVVAEAADVNTLRFISIVLNGFQGVFIFLSFICNKRVLKLYMLNLSSSERVGEHNPSNSPAEN